MGELHGTLVVTSIGVILENNPFLTAYSKIGELKIVFLSLCVFLRCVGMLEAGQRTTFGSQSSPSSMCSGDQTLSVRFTYLVTHF